MTCKLSEVQKKLIDEIAGSEGFNSYLIEAKTLSAKEEGPNGKVIAVTLKDHQNTLELIIKSAANDQQQRNDPVRNAIIRQTYEREIFTYENTLPKFHEFAKKMGLEMCGHSKFYGKCFVEGSECLVLDNLRKQGFELYDQNKPMDPTHTALVLKEYAKLHSISMAMKEKNPKVFDKLREELSASAPIIDQETRLKFFKNAVQSAKKLLEGQDSTKGTTRFQKVSSAFEDFTSIAREKYDDSLTVITHGDCWCNNIMFKYENLENSDTRIPKKVCFIDWQLSEVGSPVNDLCYFLFICCGKDILNDQQKYLKIYTDAVAENLRRISCDSEKIFSVDLFGSQWRKYSKYGIFVTFGLLKMLLFGTEAEKEAVYKRRVTDLVEFLNED